jgi:hypothetical protein
VSVTLDIQGCEVPAEITRIVEVELGQPIVPDETPGGLRIEVACDAQSARLLVKDAAGFAARTVDLGDGPPSARARLIALAAVELVSRSTPHAPPSAAHVTAAPEPIDNVAPRSSAGPRLGMTAFGGGIIFDSNTGLLGGGGLRVSRSGTPIGFLVDVRAHHGESAVPRGRVTTDVVDAGVGAVVGRPVGQLYFSLAAGARGGGVRLAGTAEMEMVRTNKFWAPWAGGFAHANLELQVLPRVMMHLTIEGGYVVSPVGALVDDVRAAGIDGPWMGVHLGIGTIL